MATCDPQTSSNPPSVEALFPEETDPQVRLGKLSALCSLGYTPLIITGAIRQLLLQHFVDPDNIRNANLRRYLEREGAWSGDVTTGIYIEGIGRWRPELTEARPAIVIKEGSWKNQRVGIKDLSGSDYRDGRQSFSSFWHGSHAIFALGGQGAETQILATEIAKLLVWFGSEIADEFGLFRFLVTEIGELAAVQEATENYVVPVSVAYVAEERWELQLEAPRLKRIIFDAEEIIGGL